MDNPPSTEYPPIGDYAVIGDGRTAALISRTGSIDWLCLPRFDSASVFARILDVQRGGTFAIQPADPFRAVRCYEHSTNILVTSFTTAGGALRLIDYMPALSEHEKRHTLLPFSSVLRHIECTAGQVTVDVHCSPRPNYGRCRPLLVQAGPNTVRTDLGDRVLQVGADFPLGAADAAVSARLTLAAGDRRTIALTYDPGPAIRPPVGQTADRLLAASRAYWRQWASRMTYDGPYRDAVVRSALTLKLLMHAPSGSIVAAPTTSLPEAIGGNRNWDYRFCWLRDAAFTVRALFAIGHFEEATAFFSWLLHATRLTQPAVKVLYNVHGIQPSAERALPWLSGYAGSAPVRVGNGAVNQFQLDVYGELLDAAALIRRGIGHLDRPTCRFLLGLADVVIRRWREPDDGIWESRAGAAQHVYSKVMAWVALSRMIEIVEAEGLALDRPDLERTRQEIQRFIQEQGYNKRLNSYTQVVGGQDVDASLLRMPLVDFLDPDDPRMLGTIAAIRQQLDTGTNDLLYRYRTADGLPAGEGAFALCSFWLAEALARAGRLDDATSVFEGMIARSNDVGLYAEEIDPRSQGFLGNFPQAFTHIGLINAAVTLAEAASQRSAVQAG